jgi:hypothetical protein
MRLSTATTTATTALFFLAGPTSANLLAPLSSVLSTSPIFALQQGFSQFNGLLSPAVFSTVFSKLAILPARSSSLTGPLQKAFLATQLALSQSDQATLIDAQAVRPFLPFLELRRRDELTVSSLCYSALLRFLLEGLFRKVTLASTRCVLASSPCSSRR